MLVAGLLVSVDDIQNIQNAGSGALLDAGYGG